MNGIINIVERRRDLRHGKKCGYTFLNRIALSRVVDHHRPKTLSRGSESSDDCLCDRRDARERRVNAVVGRETTINAGIFANMGSLEKSFFPYKVIARLASPRVSSAPARTQVAHICAYYAHQLFTAHSICIRNTVIPLKMQTSFPFLRSLPPLSLSLTRISLNSLVARFWR